jgi:hypothetical protein
MAQGECMNLNSIIKDGSAVIAMEPEDLALAGCEA